MNIRHLPTLAVSTLALGILALTPSSSALVPDNSDGTYSGGFQIASRRVIPDSRYIARFRVLGAEITSNGNYDLPVTARIKVGNTTLEPFGALASPVAGNVNDHQFPKDHILGSHYSSGTAFTIEAKSWKRSSSYTNGSLASDWVELITVSSSVSSANMIVLRNGDSVPNIPAFQNQAGIGEIIRDHVNVTTGKVVIADDEAIFLYELGTTNLTSSAADFQDFVILVTLADDKVHFEGPRVPPSLQFD
jgi:hypothetical protein